MMLQGVASLFLQSVFALHLLQIVVGLVTSTCLQTVVDGKQWNFFNKVVIGYGTFKCVFRM